MSSTRGFIRRTSRDALRSYFDKRNLRLPDDFDWTEPQPALGKALIAAIETMSDVDRTRFNIDAERVTDMADEPGQAALTNIVTDETFNNLKSAYDRALWVFLDVPKKFARAEQVRYADERRLKKMWDGWVAKPDLVLNRDEQSLNLFKEEIRKQFGSHHVHVDVFDRNRRVSGGSIVPVVQIAIYRDGQPTDDLAFGPEDELVRRSRRPVLEAALTYDSDSGTVEVVAGDRETREELLRCVVRDLMGIELKGNKLPFKKYRLDVLLKPHDFPTDLDDEISGVEVRSLRLMPMDEQTERVILETGAKSTRTIWDMARSHFGSADPLASGFACTQARLSIRFKPVNGGRGKVISLAITMPHSCNLGDHTSKEQMIGEKYLNRWNLLQDA